jgi:uncharacterized protein (TIGR02594 family)
MATRRQIMNALGCFTVGQVLFEGMRLFAASIPANIGQVPDYDGPLPKAPSILGTRPALDSEERIARQIVTKAPKGPTPFAVAKYFLAISNGQFGPAWEPYTSGWPVRWNPVIVEFFQATHSIPEGDVTSWCAAFANWCFQRNVQSPATLSASSGSFRTFGVETVQPKEGDLVVFRKTNGAPSDPQGHVGFFVADHGNSVDVLGGNQIEGQAHCHKVSSKRLLKAGPVLTVHSYRTDPRLHI